MLDGTYRGVRIRSTCSSSCTLVRCHITDHSIAMIVLRRPLLGNTLFMRYIYLAGLPGNFSLHSFNGNISMKQFYVCMCVILDFVLFRLL